MTQVRLVYFNLDEYLSFLIYTHKSCNINSNYYHVWRFLQLPSRSSIAHLDSKGRQICSQSWEDLVKYNKDNTQQKSSEDKLARYCFQSAYVYQILRNGYGFHDTDNITATNIINGQKVLGAWIHAIRDQHVAMGVHWASQ